MATARLGAGFRDLFTEVFIFTGAVDFGNAATGSGTFASVDVTVPGVALGDVVLGISVALDTIDTVVQGAVTAADTVTLTVLNNTAGAVNHASTTANVLVGRPNLTFFV